MYRRTNGQGKSRTWEDNIKVHLPHDDSWKVEIFIPFEEMSNNNLTVILRAAKIKISRRHKIPVGFLAYQDLMQKDVKSEGYQVTAKIVRGEAEKGEPALRFLSAVSDGTEYKNSIILALSKTAPIFVIPAFPEYTLFVIPACPESAGTTIYVPILDAPPYGGLPE